MEWKDKRVTHDTSVGEGALSDGFHYWIRMLVLNLYPHVGSSYRVGEEV